MENVSKPISNDPAPGAKPSATVAEQSKANVEVTGAGIALCATGDGLPPIRTAEQLLADSSLKFPEEIIEGRLHRGTKCVAAGASKCGKSWACLDMGMSIATGTPWLGWKTIKGKVLYVNFEIMEVAFADRIRKVKAAKIEDFGPLDFSNFEVHTMRGSSVSFNEFIEKLIRRLKGQDYSLIIIDPFYKGMVGKDENKASAVNPLCALLDKLAQHTGAAVVLAHHFPKGKQNKKPIVNRLVGSGVIARDADTIIALTEHQEPGCLTMEFVLRNFPDQPPLVIERQIPRFVIRDDLDPAALDGQEDANGNDKAEALLALLGPAGLTASKWEERAQIELGIPRATFFREKKKLVDQGHVALDDQSKNWRKAE